MLLRSSHREPPRRALITGASSGIGVGFARALPHADLLLAGRDRDSLQTLAAELKNGDARRIETVTADLAEPKGRAALVRAAEAFEVDLLVNNAGMGSYGPFIDSEQAREEATVLVNALAPVALTRALLPGMVARAADSRHRAGLINVCSTLAFVPVPYGAVYGASKAFVLSFTEAIAAELADQPIDVLAVCPGPVRTDFYRRVGFPGGAPPGAQSPDQVARRAVRELGRHSTGFTDMASALALRPIVDLRAGISRTLALGIGAFRTFRSRRAG